VQELKLVLVLVNLSLLKFSVYRIEYGGDDQEVPQKHTTIQEITRPGQHLTLSDLGLLLSSVRLRGCP